MPARKWPDDINSERGAEVAAPIPANINYKEQLEMLVAKTRETWGKIDVLVCNAALNPYYGSSLDIPDEAFDKIMGANIRSNHWLSQMVIPEMVERKDGSIIIISSIGGPQRLAGDRRLLHLQGRRHAAGAQHRRRIRARTMCAPIASRRA